MSRIERVGLANSDATMTQLHPSGGSGFRAVPLVLLQPLLDRIVRRVAARHPELFDRLGPYRTALYVIDPVDMPFALLLGPNPDRLIFRAAPRQALPPHQARIAGRFLTLLRIIDAEADGDALFFSRDLDVTGDTEAVVRLRNALDDVDGSITEEVAGLFGPPGRFALSLLRRMAENRAMAQGAPT